MINGTIANPSALYHFGEILATGAVSLLQRYNLAVVLLALFGLFSVFSAISGKIYDGVKNLFRIFIAIPIIIILGLLDKKNREERKKEIGDIVAHLKSNPEKSKALTYKIILIVLGLLLVVVVYIIMNKFVVPMYQLSNVTM